MSKNFVYESIYDYVKPKSEEDIKKSLKNLSPEQKLQIGCKLNILWIVQEALDEDVDPSIYHNKLFYWAVQNRYYNLVTELIKDPRVRLKLSKFQISIFENYIKESLSDYVKPKTQEEINRVIEKLPTFDAFYEACKMGMLDIVEKLFPKLTVKFTTGTQNQLAGIVCSRGHLNILKFLLEKFPEIDLGDDRSWGFEMACFYGHYDVIKFLLKRPDVNPNDRNNEAFKNLIKSNRLDIIKLLLKDSRVNQNINLNDFYEYAELFGKYEVADFLRSLIKETTNESLSDYVKPKSEEEIKQKLEKLSPFGKLKSACQYGFLPLAQELLKEYNFRKTQLNLALYWSCGFGQANIVKLLLEETDVDPSVDDNSAIQWASEEGNVDVIKLLLSDKRVRDSLSQNELQLYKRQLTYLKESLSDYVKPKSEEEIEKIFSSLTPPEKFDLVIKDKNTFPKTKVKEFFKQLDPKIQMLYLIKYEIHHWYFDYPINSILDSNEFNELINNVSPNLKLQYGCVKGNLELVKKAMSEGAQVYHTNLNEYIPNDLKGLKPIKEEKFNAFECALTGIPKLKIAEYLIKNYFSLIKDNYLKPILILCVDQRMYSTVQFLLTQPRILNLQLGVTQNPIINAAYNRDMKMVELILSSKLKLPDFKKSLKAAAEQGSLKILKYLIKELNLDPSFDDNKLINIAAEYGQYHVVAYLMSDSRVSSKLDLRESLSDYVKPKTQEQIKRDAKNLKPDVKLRYGLKNNIYWLVKKALEENCSMFIPMFIDSSTPKAYGPLTYITKFNSTNILLLYLSKVDIEEDGPWRWWPEFYLALRYAVETKNKLNYDILKTFVKENFPEAFILKFNEIVM